MQAPLLLRAERDLQDLLQPVPAHNGGDAQRQPVQAVLAVQHHGYGQDGVLVPDDGGRDAANAHGDAIAGDPLPADDLIGAVPDLAVHPIHILRPERPPPDAAEVLQVQPRYVGLAPYRQLAVAVLADDEGVDVPAVHPQLLPQQLLQPPGVQHRSRADDPLSGIARQLPGRVGQHVHRVGHDQEDAAEVPGGDLPDHGAQDGDIPADQVQPGLAGLLVGSGGDNDQGAVGDVIIAPRRDLHGRAVRKAIAEVHGLPFRFVLIGVQQHQMGKQSLLQKPEGNGRANEAAAYNGCFSGIDVHGNDLLFCLVCAQKASM